MPADLFIEHPSLCAGMRLLPEPAVQVGRAYAERMRAARGSKTKHQARPGGYLEHLDECFAYAARFYCALTDERRVDFGFDETLTPLWLHDIAKVFHYTEARPGDERYDRAAAEMTSWEFALKVARDFDVPLSGDQVNALRYIHGEIGVHHPTERWMGSMATLCHMADIWSARGAHDEPRISGPLSVHPLLLPF